MKRKALIYLIFAGFGAFVLLKAWPSYHDNLERKQASEQVRASFAALTRQHVPGEDNPQLWAHRGYHRGGAPENTVEAMLAAIELGFPGVELDVFWGPGLVVQHEPPSPDKIANGDYLSLEAFLSVKPPRVYLYLDFKNLALQNVEAVAKELHLLLSNDNQIGTTFVESKNGQALAALRRFIPDIRTLYWITDYKYPDVVMADVVASGTRAVSIPNMEITAEFLHDFSHLRIHTFTVNFLARARELADAGVSVILTDVDFSEELPDLMGNSDGSQ